MYFKEHMLSVSIRILNFPAINDPNFAQQSPFDNINKALQEISEDSINWAGSPSESPSPSFFLVDISDSVLVLRGNEEKNAEAYLQLPFQEETESGMVIGRNSFPNYVLSDKQVSREQLRVWAQRGPQGLGLRVTVVGRNSIEVFFPSGSSERVATGSTVYLPINSYFNLRIFGETFRLVCEQPHTSNKIEKKPNHKKDNKASEVKREWGATQILHGAEKPISVIENKSSDSAPHKNFIPLPSSSSSSKDDDKNKTQTSVKTEKASLKKIPSWQDQKFDKNDQYEGKENNKKRKLPSWASTLDSPSKKQKTKQNIKPTIKKVVVFYIISNARRWTHHCRTKRVR